MYRHDIGVFELAGDLGLFQKAPPHVGVLGPAWLDLFEGNVPFQIVGLQEHRGANGTFDQDDVIYAPISTVIDNVVGEGTDSYTVIGVLPRTLSLLNDFS